MAISGNSRNLLKLFFLNYYKYIKQVHNYILFTYKILGSCHCTLKYIRQVGERYTWLGN